MGQYNEPTSHYTRQGVAYTLGFTDKTTQILESCEKIVFLPLDVTYGAG